MKLSRAAYAAKLSRVSFVRIRLYGGCYDGLFLTVFSQTAAITLWADRTPLRYVIHAATGCAYLALVQKEGEQ